jgi:type IV pilus assembly protein PilE
MRARSSRLVPRRAFRARRGFTLIELLAAVAALGILAAIAVPAYFEQLARARRADVQAALLEDAGYMQHYYASHDAFSGTPPPQLPFA